MTTHLAVEPSHAHAWDWAAIRAACLREAERVLGRSSDAEDAAQEAAVRAWRRRDTCNDPARPGPWVTTIARREALRIATRRAETLLAEPADAPQPASEPPALDDALHLAIDALATEDRLLLFGRYVQDLPHRELARRSGLKEGTVRVRLHRLRSVLRDQVVEP
jgi:RNA polymerase sigma-70 factor (ECF subfamily)